MKVAFFARDFSASITRAAEELASSLAASGIQCAGYFHPGAGLPDADMILSLGGDGTLLSLLPIVGASGKPVLGVNYGRMGFLSSSAPGEVTKSLSDGKYTVEQRSLLHLDVMSRNLPGLYPYALNEISIHRQGAAMLGVQVSVDNVPLPTYWADGLLVATSSGSTAYSLSVGGPIVFPGSRVLIVAPVAPHNLNVRPIVIPDSSVVRLSVNSRDAEVMLSLDNRQFMADSSLEFEVSLAPFTFNLVRVPGGEFINALTGKLYWGLDLRNNEEDCFQMQNRDDYGHKDR